MLVRWIKSLQLLHSQASRDLRVAVRTTVFGSQLVT